MEEKVKEEAEAEDKAKEKAKDEAEVEDKAKLRQEFHSL